MTTSMLLFPKSKTASFISPVTISILSSRPLSLTLLLAISALSSWISNPVRCAASVLASIRIGMIPVPVPRSKTLSPSLALANPDKRTASIPKQNLQGSWIILYPLRCRSSILSFSFISPLVINTLCFILFLQLFKFSHFFLGQLKLLFVFLESLLELKIAGFEFLDLFLIIDLNDDFYKFS